MEKVLRGERTLNRDAAERVALVLRADIFLLFEVAPARIARTTAAETELSA